MLSRKNVLITGCSAGGIGYALAEEFHARGLRVIATARRLDSMAALAALGIETLELDVTDSDAIREVKEKVAQLLGGKLDILVNNAGIAQAATAVEQPLSDVKALFAVNLFAVISMVQEFVPLLIASGQGLIMQTGSINGIIPTPFCAAYNASKAALHAYGNTLRLELAPFNIKVLTVITGAVKSNIIKPTRLPSGSLYEAMQDDFSALEKTMAQDTAMPAADYARTVVSEALKQHPPAWFWAGQLSWLVWFISTFLGQRAFDSRLSARFGLTRFAELLRSGKRKSL